MKRHPGDSKILGRIKHPKNLGRIKHPKKSWENKTSQILLLQNLNEFLQLVGHRFAKDHSTCSDELGVETTSVPWRQTPVIITVPALGQ